MRFKGPKKPAVAPFSVDPEYRRLCPSGTGTGRSLGGSPPHQPRVFLEVQSLYPVHRLFVGVGDRQLDPAALDGMGGRVKIELALIRYFNESLPDPEENWDRRRKYREIDTPLKRLRWVNRELRKEYGGLKGAWNWLLGRGLPTGKELYAKMVDEADDMIMAMEEGREVDILQEVMKYSGMEAGER